MIVAFVLRPHLAMAALIPEYDVAFGAVTVSYESSPPSSCEAHCVISLGGADVARGVSPL
jgi:hypothetical protein